ncbi:MAG: hypothetical protein AAF581_20695 [Planctomycetota bacterium]
MNRTLSLFLLVTLAVGLLPGCAYMKDRGNDFLDMGGMQISAGAQLGFNARASKLAQAGVGYATGDVAAWDGRTLAVFEENRAEAGVSVLYGNGAERHVHRANESYVKWDKFDENNDVNFDLKRDFDRGFWEIGGHVGAGFVGFGAHFDPMQMFDFLLGWFAIDFARDDARNDYRERLSGVPYGAWPEFPPATVEMEDANDSE